MNYTKIDPETLKEIKEYDIKWIARDSDGDLFGYSREPHLSGGWECESSSEFIGIDNDLFPGVGNMECIEYNIEKQPEPKNEKIKIGIRQDTGSGKLIPYDIVSGREIVGVITVQINEEIGAASAAIIRTFLHNSDGKVIKH